MYFRKRCVLGIMVLFFFSSRRRHTRLQGDWSSDVCSSDLHPMVLSICEWGRQNPWNWGAGTGAMWRTSTDLIFFGQSASLPPALSNFDQAQDRKSVV